MSIPSATGSLTFLGGAGTVTGSKYLVQTPNAAVAMTNHEHVHTTHTAHAGAAGLEAALKYAGALPERKPS